MIRVMDLHILDFLGICAAVLLFIIITQHDQLHDPTPNFVFCTT